MPIESSRMLERTPDDNPGERVSDEGGFWAVFWHGRFYRDIWLLLITVLVLVAVNGNAQTVDSIQANRIEATRTSCDKTNDVIKGVNAGTDRLAILVITSQLLPGDISLPKDAKTPFEWQDIEPGPLSKSIVKTIPGYPPPKDRLKTAKRQAEALQDEKIAERDCDAEVKNVETVETDE